MYVCTVAVLCLFLHHAFHSMEVLSAACSTWSHGIGARGHVTFFLSPLVCIYSHHCACPLVWGCGWQLVFWIPHTRHLAPFCMWQKQRRIECLLGVREICFETIFFFLSCICVVVTCTIMLCSEIDRVIASSMHTVSTKRSTVYHLTTDASESRTRILPYTVSPDTLCIVPDAQFLTDVHGYVGEGTYPKRDIVQ